MNEAICHKRLYTDRCTKSSYNPDSYFTQVKVRREKQQLHLIEIVVDICWWKKDFI